MDKIINGKALAKKHEDSLKVKVAKLKMPPHIVSFFNPQDSLFVYGYYNKTSKKNPWKRSIQATVL